MNNSYNSNPENPISSSIDPYYVQGDVFQRDQRYYDQVYSTRRNRTPNKGVDSLIGRAGQTIQPGQTIQQQQYQSIQPVQPNQGANLILPSGPNYLNTSNAGQSQMSTSNVNNNIGSAVNTIVNQDQEQLRRIR